jgi:type IV pilus assembly protein PilO
MLGQSPEAVRRAVILGIPLLLVAGYYFGFHGERTDRIAKMETRLEKLDQQNRTARVLAAEGGPELERRLALYEEHMVHLEQLIPSAEEVPRLLHAMSVNARDSGVELALVKPEAETASPFYSLQTYQVGVIGQYHDVGRFLASIGSLPRIVTPIDLKLVPQNRPDPRTGILKVEANFRIQTYVLPAPEPAVSTETDART